METKILKPNDFKAAGYPKVKTKFKGNKAAIAYMQNNRKALPY